jgi:hypothetical protein
MRPWLGLSVLVALGACSDNSRSTAPLLNRCDPALPCSGGTSCDPDLAICTNPTATIPYDYRVQVTPTGPSDAGVFAAATSSRTTLTDAGQIAIQLARVVTARGNVLSFDMQAMEAELVFTPRDDSSLGGALSVFTRPGEGGQVYEAQLEPNRTYDVLVYPRGADSERCPPFAGELQTGTVDESRNFRQEQELTRLQGRIVDEDEVPAPANMRVKTRFRDRLLASSSIGTIGPQGNFEIWVPASVLAAPASHELALDLSGAVVNGHVIEQNVQIGFDLAEMPDNLVWTMPKLPTPVLLTGTVEMAQLQGRKVQAQLTFISSFELPTGNFQQRDADWCRLTLPRAPRDTFRCSANVSTTVEGDLSIRLLPGQYDIVITPTGAADTQQDLTTLIKTETLRTQEDDGPNGPITLQLTPVGQFVGIVKGPGELEMPSVSVFANALRVEADLTSIALYNRSASEDTSYNGQAKLSIDVGVYDLLAAPPADSGYAWVLWFNRRIQDIAQPIPTVVRYREFEMTSQAPVLLRGSARTTEGERVAEANVDAYALVPNLEGGPDRPVRIAHTTTDRDGEFTLQMPPCIGSPDDLPSDGGMPAKRCGERLR